MMSAFGDGGMDVSPDEINPDAIIEAAEIVRDNEEPNSNTHVLVGGVLVAMAKEQKRVSQTTDTILNSETERQKSFEESQQERDEKFEEEMTKYGDLPSKVEDLENKTDDVVSRSKNIYPDKNDCFYVTDKDGNIVAKIDANGMQAVEFLDKEGKTFTDIVEELKELIAESSTDGVLPKFYEDKFYVCDNKGYAVLEVSSNGIKSIAVDAPNILKNDWHNKVIATYGDSVTALQNGDFDLTNYTETSYRWGNRVGKYFSMSKHYGRGIGGQGYRWQTAAGNGGSVSFIKADGNFDSRNDSYNYDNYTGATPSGCIKVRGCLAAWNRITAMFPPSIKDTIDVVLVMAHNDGYDTNACRFVENDITDAEWAASGAEYYGKIGGDYDLTTFRGGVASTIMKLQLWMPNAIIVLMTGISGQGTTGQINKNINSDSSINKANAIKEMSTLTSIPCIDVFSTDGINGWNRVKYIADTIHPYTVDGSKMIARSIIGGLENILPNI